MPMGLDISTLAGICDQQKQRTPTCVSAYIPACLLACLFFGLFIAPSVVP